jgi:hypothetical protein
MSIKPVKEICLKCYLKKTDRKLLYGHHPNGPIGEMTEFFENIWIQHVMDCRPLEPNLRRTNVLPAECPYYLEQIVNTGIK